MLRNRLLTLVRTQVLTLNRTRVLSLSGISTIASITLYILMKYHESLQLLDKQAVISYIAVPLVESNI